MNTLFIVMEDTWDRTQRKAMALIEAERSARVEKTERLRLMRMAKGGSEPAHNSSEQADNMKQKGPPLQET